MPLMEARSQAAYARTIQADEPVAGYYLHRFNRQGAFCGIHIWHGPPKDPLTGEELDRSLRWQAEVNGEYAHIDEVWPACAKNPTTADEYRRRCAVLAGNQRSKIDPLSAEIPFSFGALQ